MAIGLCLSFSFFFLPSLFRGFFSVFSKKKPKKKEKERKKKHRILASKMYEVEEESIPNILPYISQNRLLSFFFSFFFLKKKHQKRKRNITFYKVYTLFIKCKSRSWRILCSPCKAWRQSPSFGQRILPPEKEKEYKNQLLTCNLENLRVLKKEGLSKQETGRHLNMTNRNFSVILENNQNFFKESIYYFLCFCGRLFLVPL